MCGIVGYIGSKNAMPVLLDGLKRLEYRGYDSAGIAISNFGSIESVKSIGKIINLEKKINNKTFFGNVGIAHTRWATHGQPSEENAHPHSDCTGDIWVVHNGIIENYQSIKDNLIKKGHKFKSETDTEVIPHLIEDFYNGDIREAIFNALKVIKGAYGMVVMSKNDPGKLFVARQGSPLVIGVGKDEIVVASDVSAIIRLTRQVIYLEDGEIAEITNEGYDIFDINFTKKDKNLEEVEWDLGSIEKEGFDHFMIKEIYEQPKTIIDSVRGRYRINEGKAKFGGFEEVIDKIRQANKLHIVACGTAMNAGLVGEYIMEEYAGIKVEVDFASEFRYRKPVLDRDTIVLAISQSGETADTLAAIKEAKEKGLLTLGIVNAVGSTIARETDAGVYNHIGPEISVASTKAFTSQVVIIALMAVLLGRQRDMSLATGKRIIEEIIVLPDKIKKITDQNNHIKNIAEKYYKYKNIIYLGRKYNYPVAMEGALKLKELSYVHAEGLPSGELKHGSIALIDENFPSIFITPKDSVYEKNISNIEEVKSRKGKIIAIGTEGDDNLKKIADDIIYIPKTLEMLTPILSTIPLQLFAYHMAILNNCDVDKPRNLAKSVTVE